MAKTTCAVDECGNPARTRGWCHKHYALWYRHGSPTGEPGPRPTVQQRLLSRTKIDPDGCWEYTGFRVLGYGIIVDNGQRLHAHRVALATVGVDVPDDMLVDHICHNKGCVRPSHLRITTQKQNVENWTKQRADNTSGHRGVSWHKARKKWRVQVKHDGNLVYSGYFTDLEEAGAAAAEARNKYHTHNDKDRA